MYAWDSSLQNYENHGVIDTLGDALDEADGYPKTEGFPSYYHSGLTPPMKRVVELRYSQREHPATPPPHAEVTDVEEDLLQLMNQISMEEDSTPKRRERAKSKKKGEKSVVKTSISSPW